MSTVSLDRMFLIVNGPTASEKNVKYLATACFLVFIPLMLQSEPLRSSDHVQEGPFEEIVRRDYANYISKLLEFQEILFNRQIAQRIIPEGEIGFGLCYYDNSQESIFGIVGSLRWITEQHLEIKRYLEKSPFPKEEWESIVSKYSGDLADMVLGFSEFPKDFGGINQRDVDFYEEITSVLNLYAVKNSISLPFPERENNIKIMREYGCGGDSYQNLNVALPSEQASLQVMFEFDAKFCEYVGFEPFSNTCPGLLLSPDAVIGEGTYAYQVSWPDRQISCGFVELISIAPPDEVDMIRLNPIRGDCNGWN